MGEARRRKAAASRTVTYTDEVSGKAVVARMAGDPLDHQATVRRVVFDYLEGRGDGDMHVPCNGCTACCYHPGVDVDPVRDADRIKYLDIEQRDDGLFLRKREDGACVHLGPTGCTVYDHRPFCCRNYDCRIYVLTGVLDGYDGDHCQPPWIFHPRDMEARIFLAACQMLGLLEYRRLNQDGTASAKDVAKAVFGDVARLDAIRAAMRQFANAPREQRMQALARYGIDPAGLTPERAQEVMRQFVGGQGRGLVLTPEAMQ